MSSEKTKRGNSKTLPEERHTYPIHWVYIRPLPSSNIEWPHGGHHLRFALAVLHCVILFLWPLLPHTRDSHELFHPFTRIYAPASFTPNCPPLSFSHQPVHLVVPCHMTLLLQCLDSIVYILLFVYVVRILASRCKSSTPPILGQRLSVTSSGVYS